MHCLHYRILSIGYCTIVLFEPLINMLSLDDVLIATRRYYTTVVGYNPTEPTH